MTEPELWREVDDYIESQILSDTPGPRIAAERAVAAQLPHIAVSPPLGALLAILAKTVGARRVLEVGTLGGYSTLWLAQALPTDGEVVTLEIDATHAATAMESIRLAQPDARVEVRLGPALDSLDQLIAEAGPPFDLAFIDADKTNNARYVERALQLCRPGALIVVDNVVRDGRVLDAESTDESVRGTRALNEFVAGQPRLEATAIQTVGSKGYDGFLLAMVRAD
jgi:predicted O-methyltransferase YrrM